MKRIGLIVPSSNPTIEAFLPSAATVLDVQFLVTRLGVRRIAADADADAQFDRDELAAAAALLTDSEVSLISWAGTSGFWLGADRENAALTAVSDAVGTRVTSSRQAILAALDETPRAALGVLTPYTDAVHAGVLATIRDAEGQITSERALGIERNLDFAAIRPDTIAAELRALAAAGGEVLAVICTNVLATLPQLRDEGFVVVDSVLATLWHAARLTGTTSLTYADCYHAALQSRPLTTQELA